MRVAVLMMALICASPAEAQSGCRQALALGLDVSGSVDAQEYRLQLDGLAAALGDAEVRAALLGQGTAPVRIAVYEWSAPGDDRLVLDWTEISDASALADVQSILRSTRRGDMGPSTGLGEALRVGISLLEQQPDCWNRTLDISGDGKANTGQRPQSVSPTPDWITVNGLVIGSDDAAGGDHRQSQIGELAAYYAAYVIRGPLAFVETAIGFADYENAMRRKLLRELAVLTIGQADIAQ